MNVPGSYARGRNNIQSKDAGRGQGFRIAQGYRTRESFVNAMSHESPAERWLIRGLESIWASLPDEAFISSSACCQAETERSRLQTGSLPAVNISSGSG